MLLFFAKATAGEDTSVDIVHRSRATYFVLLFLFWLSSFFVGSHCSPSVLLFLFGSPFLLWLFFLLLWFSFSLFGSPFCQWSHRRIGLLLFFALVTFCVCLVPLSRFCACLERGLFPVRRCRGCWMSSRSSSPCTAILTYVSTEAPASRSGSDSWTGMRQKKHTPTNIFESLE